jgi:hypothetical protein
MANIYTHDDLIGRMKSPGWSLITGRDNTLTGTLSELLHVTHWQHQNGKPPGLLRETATSFALEMLQIEQLWRYLGLPV